MGKKPTKKEMAHDNASAQPKSGHQSSTVLSPINDLDEHLLTEILKRLPSAREATACKLVSKNWCSLITTPYFVSRFVDHYRKCHPMEPTRYSLFCASAWYPLYSGSKRLVNDEHVYDHEPSKKRVSFSSLLKFLSFRNRRRPRVPPSRRSELITSYHDLVLCSRNEYDCDFYYIVNPSTKVRLPLPPFTRAKSWVLVGLVYDNQKQSFRVARIEERYDHQYRFLSKKKNDHQYKSYRVEMFCSEVNKWSKMVLVPPSPIRFGYGLHAFSWNCFMHWLSLDNKTFAYNPYNPSKCYVISNPPSNDPQIGYQSKAQYSCLGGCQGSIVLCRMLFDECAAKIWELTDYEAGQWILKHCVSLPNQGCIPADFEKLFVDPNDNQILYFMFYKQVCVWNLGKEVVEPVNGAKSYNVVTLPYYRGVHVIVDPIWPTCPALYHDTP
ncbi:hypothetical protein Tsubulata_048265 [Turnera subulata]|uniref:F-box domain-containing protein n=1 Tax=Turnera subulata TaxID=218843 RepID=A0A9Q0JBT0_9ROSI|nr:hypothetical protein Tsubulata_048265 [Turnera subulata]